MSERHIANPSKITGYLIQLSCVIVVVCGLVALVWEQVWNSFSSNIPLNGTIVACFFLGSILCFIFIAKLRIDVIALSVFDELLMFSATQRKIASEKPELKPTKGEMDEIPKPKMNILASSFTVLNNNVTKSGDVHLNPATSKSLMDSIQEGLDERVDYIVYFTNLLVYLGLLGTFLGLTITIASIGGIIKELADGLTPDANIMVMLQSLIAGLQEPLAGMATAFGSSLIGLSTSLVLGIMCLILSHANSYFLTAMESWLVQHTFTGESSTGGGGARVHLDGALISTDDPEGNSQLTPLINAETRVAEVTALQTKTLNDIREHLLPLGKMPDIFSQAVQVADKTLNAHQTLLENIQEQALQHNAKLDTLLSALGSNTEEVRKSRQLNSESRDAVVDAVANIQTSKHNLVSVINSLRDEQQSSTQLQQQIIEYFNRLDERLHTLSKSMLPQDTHWVRLLEHMDQVSEQWNTAHDADSRWMRKIISKLHNIEQSVIKPKDNN